VTRPRPGSGRRGAGSGATGAGRRPARPGPEEGDGERGDPALEEALRAWRRERSGRDGVPAYVVFADRTLRAIAVSRPSSLTALRAVDGIGPTKLELYGEDILALVGATPVSS
jgi:superfamily II DNA helicase RecQ